MGEGAVHLEVSPLVVPWQEAHPHGGRNQRGHRTNRLIVRRVLGQRADEDGNCLARRSVHVARRHPVPRSYADRAAQVPAAAQVEGNVDKRRVKTPAETDLYGGRPNARLQRCREEGGAELKREGTNGINKCRPLAHKRLQVVNIYVKV